MDFIDEEKLEEAKNKVEEHHGSTIIYGVGAGLVSHGDMAELANCECPDSEVEEYVCLILGLLHNCLGKLSDEACPGNLHYLRFGNHLFASECGRPKE